MNEHSIALIGCGRIGFLLENDELRYKPCTHYGGALEAGFRISHACDTDRSRLEQFSKKAGIGSDACYTSHSELLSCERPEAVIIATSTDSHYPIALDAVKSGCRLVILEKPVTPSVSQARMLLEEAEEKGCIIMVNHERRYDSGYNQVKKMISGREIGDICTVNARMLTGRYRGLSDISEGGGPLLHDGTHLIDMLQYLFGPFRSVQGEFTRIDREQGFEDSASAWIKMNSGINVFLEAGGGRKYFQFEIEIWGTEGKILIGNGYRRLFRYEKSSLYTGFNDLREQDFPGFEKNNCFTELYREAIDILDGKQTAPRSGIEHGLQALEAVHALYYSSFRGREQILLPVPDGLIDLAEIFSLGQA